MQEVTVKKRRISAESVERALDAVETQAEIMQAKNDTDRAACFELAAKEIRKAIADG